MKTLNRINLILFLPAACFLFACQREIKNNNPVTPTTPGTVINPTPVTATVTGKVVDENNIAVSNATVKAGSNITTTDNRGLFRFNNISLDKYSSVITVEKNGYFKSIRTFSATAGATNFVKLKLLPKVLIGNIDATAGGAVNFPDNSKITIPAGAVVVKTTNAAYTGSIKVYAALIDPTSADIAQIVAGSFQGTDANNYRVILKSYGMMAVELEGASGEQLQIASGKTAKLRMTIPASLQSSAPATLPLWFLNETDGLWKQEGSATNTSNYYEGDVSHFSFWNCDIGSNSIFLELTVQTAEGPLPFTLVKITRLNNGSSSYGYTDSSGHVGGLVFSNEPLKLEILNTCNQAIYSQNIGPYSTNTNLGTITVTLLPQFTLQITGSAVNCANQPVTNGNALIYFEGHLYNKPITAGNFSLTITRCSNSTGAVEVIAVDNSANQQSAPWNGTASTGTVSTGTLSACGTSTISYINYTLDAVNFSLSSATAGDSITLYSLAGTSQNVTSISGFRISNPNVHINFYTQGAAVGTFPLIHLQVNQYDSVNVVTPFNINITTYGAPGQFIEGNFSGQIREIANNNLHNISATFKVRRL